MAVIKKDSLYVEIREDIKAKIASGALVVGDRIPTTAEMRERYGASTITVRRAIEDLVRERMLVGRQGSGVYVNSCEPEEARVEELIIGCVARRASYVTQNYFSQILGGLSAVASSRKYSVKICENERLESPMHHRNVKTDGGIAGFVVVDQLFSFSDALLLKSQEVPFVLVDEVVGGVDCYLVRLDYGQGVRDACAHLFSLGHTRIALLLTSKTQSQDFYFLRGYEEAMEDMGLPLDESLVKFRNYMELSIPDYARAMLEELRGLSDAPTAIISDNDEVSVEIMHFARGMGVRIPYDLSLVGMNDIAYIGLERPKLTRIAGDLSQLGTEAVEMLIAITERKNPPKQKLLPMTLKIGGTTAPRVQ